MNKKNYWTNGSGATTKALVSSTLGSILSTAFKQGLIETNPMLRVVHHPSMPKSQSSPLSATEVDQLLSIDDEYKQFWIIMIGTMMRISEAMALRWSDVNMVQNYVSITKQYHIVFGKPMIESPKSESSIRDIYFGESVRNAFQVWKGQQLINGNADNDLVFPNSLGNMHNGQMFRKVLKERLEHLDINPRRIHDLRSTGATLASAQGIDIKSLHVQLGHSNIKTTLDYYNKPDKSTIAKESTKLDAVLG